MREDFRKLRESDSVALGDVLQRAVQRLVRNLDARAIRVLNLDLLHDQALEDLLAQDVLRWKLELLLPHAVGDDRNLFIEVAIEDDTVIDDRGDAIEQYALGRQLAGLGFDRTVSGQCQK